MAAAVPCPHLHLSGDSYSPQLMLLFHRILFPGSVCPTRLHFPTILVFRGATVTKFWPLGCQVKSCISLPSLVIGTAYMTGHIRLPSLLAATEALLPGWLGGTKVTELYCISLSYTSAISVTLAAKSSGPQQPDEVWPRQPESYQAVARKATRQKWGVRRGDKGAHLCTLKLLSAVGLCQGVPWHFIWNSGLNNWLPYADARRKKQGKILSSEGKGIFSWGRTFIVSEESQETLTRLAGGAESFNSVNQGFGRDLS